MTKIMIKESNVASMNEAIKIYNDVINFQDSLLISNYLKNYDFANIDEIQILTYVRKIADKLNNDITKKIKNHIKIYKIGAKNYYLKETTEDKRILNLIFSGALEHIQKEKFEFSNFKNIDLVPLKKLLQQKHKMVKVKNATRAILVNYKKNSDIKKIYA